jgi:hypothetical protein
MQGQFTCQFCGQLFLSTDKHEERRARFCSKNCYNQLKAGPFPERFWAKVGKTESCWLWTGSRLGRGYGMFRHNGKTVKAHRIAWELEYGPVPQGLYVLHTCDNPPCVRPEHLFLGTQFANMRDMVSKGRCRPQGQRASPSDEIARVIADRYAAGTTQRVLAVEFGWGQSTISRTIHRLTRPAPA